MAKRPIQTPDDMAQEWLEEMIDNLAKAEQIDFSRAGLVSVVDRHIDRHAERSPFFSDMARNAALRAISDQSGLVAFTSPDNGRRALTTGHRLQQMLQAETVGEALSATDGFVVY